MKHHYYLLFSVSHIHDEASGGRNRVRSENGLSIYITGNRSKSKTVYGIFSKMTSGERLICKYTKFDFTVDEGKEQRLNPSLAIKIKASTAEGRWRNPV